MQQRIVSWFSCGAASAVATKIALEEWRKDPEDKDFIIACIYLEQEHKDNERFITECQKWFNHEIIIIKDEKYNSSVDKVIEKTRYMSGVMGARCTKELKKQVRFDYQRDDDIHVFGMTSEEAHRIDRIIDAEPLINISAPLIDQELNKKDCFEYLNAAGIELPVMYKLGFHNNNCIGCVKAGGAGYWNHIRKHFPETFELRSKQEQMLNVALCKMSLNKFKTKFTVHHDIMKRDHEQGLVKWAVDANGSIRIPLRYLPPESGNLKDLNIGSCGFICEVKN